MEGLHGVRQTGRETDRLLFGQADRQLRLDKDDITSVA